ncbi:hypothetical protein [Bacillus sp. AK128]
MFAFLKALFVSFLQLGAFKIGLILLIPILVFTLVKKLRKPKQIY